jgi:hypothetical protein
MAPETPSDSRSAYRTKDHTTVDDDVIDEEDLRAFEDRASEPVVSYEALLTKLKEDGKM